MQTNRSRNQWFIWQVSSLILLIFFVSAFSGLATVWLRNQIAAHASNIRAAEEESIKIEKKLDTLNAEIAKAHHPEFLNKRIAALGLDLRPAKGAQIVRLQPERRMPVYYADTDIRISVDENPDLDSSGDKPNFDGSTATRFVNYQPFR